MKDLSKVEPLSDSRKLVLQARIAWTQIKEDAPKRRALPRRLGFGIKAHEESQYAHRFWWLQIGQALAFGKQTSRSDPAYHVWLKENGLEGIPRSARMHAIWFAKNIKTLGEIPNGLAHPATIRRWAYERDHPALAPTVQIQPTEPAQHGLHQIEETPLQPEAPSALGQQVAANLVDMQRAADLMLEASMHMLRSVDLIHEMTQVLRGLNNGR